MLRWSHAIVKVFDKNVSSVDGDAAEQATIDFVAYLTGVLQQRRRKRGEDLISSMLEVEDGGGFDLDDVMCAEVFGPLHRFRP